MKILNICPICKSKYLEREETIHHYVCAYVGPKGDYGMTNNETICPKCCLPLRLELADWEVVGTSVKCLSCSRHFLPDHSVVESSKE